MAVSLAVKIIFDRGTLLLHDVPGRFDVAGISGVRWDPRVGAYRSPACFAYSLVSECRRSGVPLSDAPRPRLVPPSGLRAPVLRPYQESALAAWRFAGRRGVVVLPTGAGKTQLALAAMASTRTACLCLVPTRALMGQWIAALSRVYDGPIGCFGDGTRVLHPVTIATFASAYHHMPLLGDRFGLLVVDEAHHFGNGVRDEALEMSIAPLRLGLTATPSEAGGRSATRLSALVGPVVFALTVADLEGDYLAPIDRTIWHLRLGPDERREYDDLCSVYRKAFRTFLGNHLHGSWENFLRDAARTDDGRRGIAAWRRARRLLAFPRCKQQALGHLLDRHRAQQTLIFVADNQTAYDVARAHLIMPLTCDIGRTERQDVLDRFRVGALRALVSAQVLNEGLDVPDAEVGIVVAGRLGGREHVQRVGRLLRPAHGKRAVIHELVVGQSSEVGQAKRRWEQLALRGRPAA